MRLGIMQPYIFPYIGYFQLIHAVDKFVVYDDVSFIKQGWINRNRILLNGKDFLFSVPLKDISSFKTIRETLIDSAKYEIWVKKFLVTLTQAYKKARYFDPAYGLVKSILEGKYENVSELSCASMRGIYHYLDIDKEWVLSSSVYENHHLKAQNRVIDICKKESAGSYINAAGGQTLYSREDFASNGIDLRFLNAGKVEYVQLGNDFIPWLSIIDVLMFNSVEEVRSMLNLYELV